MEKGKTSTFTVHHDRCRPETWTPGDLLAFAEFVRTGSLQLAARLSRLGVQLVLSEHHVPKGGDIEQVGFAVVGEETTEVWPLDELVDQGDRDVTPVHRVYRGPVEYVARIAIGDDDGGIAGWEYEIKATEAEAAAYLDATEGVAESR